MNRPEFADHNVELEPWQTKYRQKLLGVMVDYMGCGQDRNMKVRLIENMPGLINSILREAFFDLMRTEKGNGSV